MIKKGSGDRRVRYTKMVLKESFIKLLSEKSVNKITIKEICDLADINRTTFYAHYTDQYDLLRKLQDELMSEIISYLTQHTKSSTSVVSTQTLERVFEYIKENSDICTLFLSESVDTNFENQVIKLFHEWFIFYWKQSGVSIRLDMEYVYAFSAYGCIGIIKKWLSEGMVTPTEEMAQLVIRMTSPGLGLFSENTD